MERRDEDLIMDYQLGNQTAIAILFERYKKPIFNFALRILANRADAEDVTGEVFLILFSKKYKENPNAKFSTWLFTIARNHCIDRIRKRKRTVSMWFRKPGSAEYEEWDPPDLDSPSIPDEDLKKREAALTVKKAISTLPAKQKEALVLREYQKLSYDEISRILGCSLENVKILIFRAREQLRKDLSSFIKEDER